MAPENPDDPTGSTPPDAFATTRLALQAVAEHVLSAALHRATGRIGLRARPGGFGTPPHPSDAGPRELRVEVTGQGADLVVTDDDGARRAPLTTLRAAGDLAGVTPGAPTAVYTPTTPLDLDARLTVDPLAAQRVADLYAVTDEALASLLAEADAAGVDGAEGVEVQLWPEHFDLAASFGEVNFGGSPGDDGHPAPYLYVGPWSPPPVDGGFWNEPFGASRPAGGLGPEDALAFFRDGRARLGG